MDDLTDVWRTQIWMYWENVKDQPRPEYLDLCMESIRMHHAGWNITVVDRHAADIMFPEMIPLLNAQPNPSLRADIVRYNLLARFGGIWLDSDTLILKNLGPLWDILDSVQRPAGGARMGVLVGAPGAGPFMAVVEYFRHHPKKPLKWGGVCEIHDTHPMFHKFTHEVVSQIRWERFNRFTTLPAEDLERASDLVGGKPLYFLSGSDAVALILYNQVLRRSKSEFRHQSREEVLRSQTIFGRIFRIALRQEELPDLRQRAETPKASAAMHETHGTS